MKARLAGMPGRPEHITGSGAAKHPSVTPPSLRDRSPEDRDFMFAAL
jgi:hypothetical protein